MPRRITIGKACENCRKCRTKCDGRTQCGRCREKRLDCTYSRAEKISKAALRDKVQQLESEQQDSDTLLRALLADSSTDAGGSSNAKGLILDGLSHGESRPSIVKRLHGIDEKDGFYMTPNSNSDEAPDSASNAGSCLTGREMSTAHDLSASPRTTRGSRGLGKDFIDNMITNDHYNSTNYDESSHISEAPRNTRKGISLAKPTCLACAPPAPSSSQWLSQSFNASPQQPLPQDWIDRPGWLGPQRDIWTSSGWLHPYVRSLILPVLSWDGIPLCVVDKDRFLHEYDDGLRLYCSSALVNALLAVATRIEEQRQKRAHPKNSELPSDVFYQEACEYLRGGGTVFNLPDTQAVGVLALYEVNFGAPIKAQKMAEEYISASAELCFSEPVPGADDQYSGVQSETYHGALALQRLFFLTGLATKPFDPSDATNDVFLDTPSDHVGVKDESESPTDAPSSTCHTQCPQRMIASICQLAGWLSKLMIAPTNDLRLKLYFRCMEWYNTTFSSNNSAVRVAGSAGGYSNSLTTNRLTRPDDMPLVTFTHLFYHFTILQILSDAAADPSHFTGILSTKKICLQAAQSIMSLGGTMAILGGIRGARDTPGRITRRFVSAAKSFLVDNNDGTPSSSASAPTSTGTSTSTSSLTPYSAPSSGPTSVPTSAPTSEPTLDPTLATLNPPGGR